jgi:hypothetical protein
MVQRRLASREYGQSVGPERLSIVVPGAPAEAIHVQDLDDRQSGIGPTTSVVGAVNAVDRAGIAEAGLEP